MSTTPDLDRTDFAILGLLMRDAWLSNKEIAAAVGLAPSSCHERLKTLRDRGVVLGAHADIDLRSIGVALEALLFVQVTKLETSQVDEFMRITAEVREVRTVFLVSGHFDLIVHVAVCDMERLKHLISDHFHRHPFVVRVETSVVFNREVQHEIPLSGRIDC